MTRPIKAILWREWRETWGALPVVVFFTLAGGLLSRRFDAVYRVDLGFTLLTGAGFGLLLAAGILLLFHNDRRDVSFVPPRDWLRLPVSTWKLAAVLLGFRTAFFAGLIVVVQLIAAFVFPAELAMLTDSTRRMLDSVAPVYSYADALMLPLAAFLVLQAAAWCTGRAAGYAVLPAAGVLLYVYFGNMINTLALPTWIPAGVGLAASAAAVAGFYAHRQGWYSALRLPTIRTGNSAFRRWSPIAAQRHHELRRIGRWYAVGVVACWVLFCGSYLLENPNALGPCIDLLFWVGELQACFFMISLFLCSIIGLYWGYDAARVLQGRGQGYPLTLPISAGAFIYARITAILICLAVHLLCLILLGTLALSLYAAIGGQIELPSMYDLAWSLWPSVTLPESMGGAIAVGIFAALYSWAFIPLWMTFTFANFLDFWFVFDVPLLGEELADYLYGFVWLLPWPFIWKALYRSPRVGWMPVVCGVPVFLATLWAILRYQDAQGGLPVMPSEWLFTVAIALLPVTAYFSWLAIYTRMRGR
ncbi:MAG: hypothetical protein GC168_12475 [Candidatus Hydrogenedens sp.]|nr:hypothetical protein [Candidatus Hydrogenedens sp.]